MRFISPKKAFKKMKTRFNGIIGIVKIENQGVNTDSMGILTAIQCKKSTVLR